MAATDNPTTLSELRTHFLEALKEVTGNSAVNTIADRYLNLGLHAMHQERWPWSERRDVILTHPGYSTGTVAIALAARTTVTGTSTLWNTAVTGMGFNNARVGGKMTFAGGTDSYVVSAVGGDTAITLATRFIGTAALTTATYQYYEDEYALVADFDDVVDMRFFNEDRTIELVGPQEFYRAYPRNTVRKAPRWATLIELGPSGSVDLRRRVLFAPAPDVTYTIPYRYYTTSLAVSTTGTLARNLSAAGDEPIVPHRYRMGIVWKGLELWFIDRKDDERTDKYAGKYAGVMASAYARRDNQVDDRPILKPRIAPYVAASRYPESGRRSGSTRFGGIAWDELRQ